ncbi:peptide/nickel transport system substrate-binding protein [Rhodococcus rhodochrous J3]|uniref:Peptide/nickel transport system substrate-binding protein n=1 Tax=Rhodococcus rhodochrous J3 TaxID=903528 RepID=A0ABY1MCS0_RHORH|nr:MULTISPECIES: ABC transporter substrate-binding protein [Rhodococcus]MBF4481128.1 ABC transporter substrate-binding protein [Rhodococcus rhodochrous]MDC3728517.1 ABC transporter substrate-binding protein [Rhodococcus sp. Rp3]WSE24183.1 ABC transporter substrate-binding protein [Rhodococcus sp. PD04]SMG45147.1 peptide/nickel transport system substrate-binding protein [Rhodococcus rhodochrous J3]
MPTRHPLSFLDAQVDRRTVLRGSLLAIALGTFGTACASSKASDQNGTRTLVEAIASMPGGLAFDAKPGGYEGFEFTQLTGAGLIRNPYIQDPDDPGAMRQDLYRHEGVLAESWEVSPDGRTYTFHLRRDVVSPAGNPFTADDVVWSYERKWNSTSIAPSISLPAITDPATQLTRIDDYTVSWTVAEAGHGFPLLAVISKISGEIYDSTLLKSHATPDDPYAVQWSNLNGNFGFGPYLMESYEDGQQITYVANEKFVLGKPPVDRIVQRVVPDAGSRASMLKTGAVDIAVQVLPADVASMAADPQFSTFDTQTNNFTWAYMQTQTPPFDNKAVRQAFAHAIPYGQIIEQVYQGRAKPVVGLLDPNLPNRSTEGLEPQTYDPDRSLQILREAGVSTPVKFTILASSAVPDLQDVAVQIQSFGKAAGFETQIEVLPAATLADRQGNKAFQVLLLRDMSVSFESPPYSLLLSYPKNNPGRNISSWENPDYYTAVEAGIAAGDSLSPEAAVHWNQAERVWQEDRPMVQIANVAPLHVFKSDVTGFAHRTDNVLDFIEIDRSASSSQ